MHFPPELPRQSVPDSARISEKSYLPWKDRDATHEAAANRTSALGLWSASASCGNSGMLSDRSTRCATKPFSRRITTSPPGPAVSDGGPTRLSVGSGRRSSTGNSSPYRSRNLGRSGSSAVSSSDGDHTCRYATAASFWLPHASKTEPAKYRSVRRISTSAGSRSSSSLSSSSRLRRRTSTAASSRSPRAR